MATSKKIRETLIASLNPTATAGGDVAIPSVAEQITRHRASKAPKTSKKTAEVVTFKSKAEQRAVADAAVNGHAVTKVPAGKKAGKNVEPAVAKFDPDAPPFLDRSNPEVAANFAAATEKHDAARRAASRKEAVKIAEATAPAAPPPAKSAGKSKSTAGNDKWGARLGSNKAILFAFLEGKGKTPVSVEEMSIAVYGSKKPAIAGVINNIWETAPKFGFVFVHDDKGYVLQKGAPDARWTKKFGARK